MVMETIQIRLSKGLVEQLDNLVKGGLYSSRSDVIRYLLRRSVIDQMVGIIPNDGKDSVKEIRKLREKLSKEPFNLDEINSYGKSIRPLVVKQ